MVSEDRVAVRERVMEGEIPFGRRGRAGEEMIRRRLAIP